jgi:hypothetical protein
MRFVSPPDITGHSLPGYCITRDIPRRQDIDSSNALFMADTEPMLTLTACETCVPEGDTLRVISAECCGPEVVTILSLANRHVRKSVYAG